MLETTNAPPPGSQQEDPGAEQKKQNVLSAVALGWSLIELLGRCFTLQLPTPEKELGLKAWPGDRMVIISPAFNSQKRLRALVCFIRSLATKLHLIDEENDHDMKTLVEKVETLYEADSVDNKLRGEINQLLFSWDMEIREKLQSMSEQLRNTYDYVNAYMVGKGFAALRWYSEKDGPSTEKLDGTKIDEEFLATLREHVQLLAPYLYKFAPLALARSLECWGDALLKQEIDMDRNREGFTSIRGSERTTIKALLATLHLPRPSGNRISAASMESHRKVPLELQCQADIWYDLLTAGRDPTTYVTPSAIAWRYTLRVILFSLPYVLLGILLSMGITVLVAFLIGALWPPIAQAIKANQTVISVVTSVGTGFSLLAGIGTALPTVKALWQWVTQKVQMGGESDAGTGLSDTGKSLVNVFWQAAQQAAINKATCVKYKRMFSGGQSRQILPKGSQIP